MHRELIYFLLILLRQNKRSFVYVVVVVVVVVCVCVCVCLMASVMVRGYTFQRRALT